MHIVQGMQLEEKNSSESIDAEKEHLSSIALKSIPSAKLRLRIFNERSYFLLIRTVDAFERILSQKLIKQETLSPKVTEIL